MKGLFFLGLFVNVQYNPNYLFFLGCFSLGFYGGIEWKKLLSQI